MFVDRLEHVRHTSGRWFISSIPVARGHWVHLTDADTGIALGWLEVNGRAARDLDDSGVCALFGDPSRRSRAVLAGPFRPVIPVGRTHPELPTPYYWIKGRALPSRWRVPRGPRV